MQPRHSERYSLDKASDGRGALWFAYKDCAALRDKNQYAGVVSLQIPSGHLVIAPSLVRICVRKEMWDRLEPVNSCGVPPPH